MLIPGMGYQRWDASSAISGCHHKGCHKLQDHLREPEVFQETRYLHHGRFGGSGERGHRALLLAVLQTSTIQPRVVLDPAAPTLSTSGSPATRNKTTQTSWIGKSKRGTTRIKMPHQSAPSGSICRMQIKIEIILFATIQRQNTSNLTRADRDKPKAEAVPSQANTEYTKKTEPETVHLSISFSQLNPRVCLHRGTR